MQNRKMYDELPNDRRGKTNISKTAMGQKLKHFEPEDANHYNIIH